VDVYIQQVLYHRRDFTWYSRSHVNKGSFAIKMTHACVNAATTEIYEIYYKFGTSNI